MQDILPQTNNRAVLTCPECGTKHSVIMPTQAKQHFFKCANKQCEIEIFSKEGECCVFCSYSDNVCPFKQINPNENNKPKLTSLI
ncbi:hypothetical protein KKD03_01065 [Patescibacteria group bacterium]|nr:hypothetical protein [Patescibacteria group bacterium]